MKASRAAALSLACLTIVGLACTAASKPTALPQASATPSAATASAARTPSGPAATAGPATASPIAQPGAPAGQVLLQQAAGGPAASTVGLRTNSFTAPGAWDLNWQYDCSALGRAGNFSVDVFDSNGGFIFDPPSLLQLGTGGRGTANYGRAGTYALDINSTCQWAFTVTTSARPTATPVGTNAGAAPTVSSAGAAFSGPSISTAANATAAAQTRGALQALQPSIPTPRPAVPPALGAFAVSATGRLPGAATATTNGSTTSSSGSTPVPSATPLRAVTPSH